MKDLDISYNSPGREAALSAMLLVHPGLRSVGVVEKEPTTRSERTFWLDTRGICLPDCLPNCLPDCLPTPSAPFGSTPGVKKRLGSRP